MPLQLTDHFALDKADMRKTADGYLVAVPRVARTGIQLYRGQEVGMPTMDTVRVYRPPEEVFSKDSMHTYGFKPITNDHPSKPVTSKNWRDHTVGLAGGEVARDGEFIRVSMTVMDGTAIDDVDAGKSELSVGYSTELKWEAGVVPGTQDKYDAIQTNIRVNHIAIVDAARGGPKLRIGDVTAPGPQPQTPDAAGLQDGEDEMSDQAAKSATVITVDGIPCTMDAMVAGIVTKSIKDLTDKLNASTAQLTTVTTDAAKAKSEYEAAGVKAATDHKTALDAKDAEIVTLKKQLEDAKLSPEKIEAMVKDRAEMLGKAKTVLGDKLVTKDKSDAEIRRQVVDAKMGEAAKGWTDELVKISFDTMTADIKLTPASGVTDTARSFSTPSGNAPGPGNWNMDAKNKAHGEADKKLSERWKNPGGAKVA